MLKNLKGHTHCESSGDQNEKSMNTDTGKFIPVKDIFKMEFPKESWLWDKMIPYGHVTVLAAAADVGKSILSRQISTHVALQKKELFGSKLNPKSGRVLYVSTEDQLPDWKDKLERFNFSEQEKEIIGKQLLVCTEYHNILPELEQQLAKTPTDLVVIDVLLDAFNDDLNNAVQIRQFFKPYKELAIKTSTALLFVHHISKNGEDRGGFNKTHILGSTSVSGGPRSIIQMIRDRSNEHIRLLKVSKGNLVSDKFKDRVLKLSLNEKLSFELVSEVLSQSADVIKVDPIEEALQLMINSGLKKPQIVAEAQKRGLAGRSKIYKILNRLQQDGNSESGNNIFCTKGQTL